MKTNQIDFMIRHLEKELINISDAVNYTEDEENPSLSIKEMSTACKKQYLFLRN